MTHADYQSMMHCNQIIPVKLTPDQSHLQYYYFDLAVFVAELLAAEQPTAGGVLATTTVAVTTDYQLRTTTIEGVQSSQATPTHCQFGQLPLTLRPPEHP